MNINENICEYYRQICIVGFGNIGKHLADELHGLDFDIKDKYKIEYSQSSNKLYKFAFICVPTEINEDGSTDISCIEEAIENIKAEIMVIKSTMPIGSAEILKQKYGKNIVVSSEFCENDICNSKKINHIVLGGNKDHCSKVAQLYYKIKDSSFRIRFVDWRTAEMIKYCGNIFLAAKSTLFNEFAKIGKLYGINYEELRECLIMDERIGDACSFVYADRPYWEDHHLDNNFISLIHQGNEESILIRSVYETNLMRKISKYNLDDIELPY